jgi:lipopolysaccharide transport system permease protein
LTNKNPSDLSTPGSNKKWEWEIGPKPAHSLFVFKSIYAYRHLHSALVRKEFLLNYQQTILGPLWIFFQPLLTLIVYVLVFSRLIGIPTGKHIPPVLFYFSGIILWNFFNETFWGISNTFRDHIHLYSKIYFPRIIVPLSVLSTNFLRFVIQLAMLAILLVYFIVFKNFQPGNGFNFLALPFVFIGIAMINIGCGLVASLLTARYRDIANLIGIVLRLLMFVTPVLYPLASVTDKLKWIVLINPLTPLFELFRFCLLGEGTVNTFYLVYSFSFGFILCIISLFLFNARSSKLIDIS